MVEAWHGRSVLPIHLQLLIYRATEGKAGSAAEQAAQLKIAKYDEIARNHIFVPLACDVTCVWCSEAFDFIYS